MRVLVCGGRDYTDRAAVYRALDRLHKKHPIAAIIQGGARGADRLAVDWATSHGVVSEWYIADWNNIDHPEAVIRYHPDGKPYNANAGPIRNQRMTEGASPTASLRFLVGLTGPELRF